MTAEAKKPQRETVKQLRAKMALLEQKLLRHVTTKGTERVNRTFSVEEKLIIVGRIAKGERAVDIAKELDIGAPTISRWKIQAYEAMSDQRGKK